MQKFGIGQSVQRFEDPRLLRGHGQFVNDTFLHDQAHAVVLRSPHAAALIKAVDTRAATAAAGVVSAMPAVMNAIMDALAQAGVKHFDMPATSQRVWRALEDAKAATAH